MSRGGDLFDKRPHVCFVFLDSQTYAHQLVLKQQWEETGATACKIGFMKNSFSLESTTYIDSSSSSSEIYTDKKSLEHHLK